MGSKVGKLSKQNVNLLNVISQQEQNKQAGWGKM